MIARIVRRVATIAVLSGVLVACSPHPLPAEFREPQDHCATAIACTPESPVYDPPTTTTTEPDVPVYCQSLDCPTTPEVIAP